MSQPPVSRAGFQDFLGEFQRHLAHLREEGVRAIEADPALVRKLGQPPAPPVPAAPPARAAATGPERWMLAERRPSGGAPVLWRVCADEASFTGDAGALLRSILAAAGFELAGEPSVAAPAAAATDAATGPVPSARSHQRASGSSSSSNGSGDSSRSPELQRR